MNTTTRIEEPEVVHYTASDEYECGCGFADGGKHRSGYSRANASDLIREHLVSVHSLTPERAAILARLA